jgi:hypothetical protein
MFDDNQDFENQLDSTKGLSRMVQAMKDQDTNDDESMQIQQLLEITENQDRDSGDIA